MSVLGIAIVAGANAANLIVNGGFEANGGVGTDIFVGWAESDEVGGVGDFYVQSGTGSPLNGFPVPAPPEGAFAAMTDQGGAGAHVIYQDIFVPIGVTAATLSLQKYVLNQAGAFVVDPTLSAVSGFANQQARIDLISATADPFSTAPVDVLQNIYQSNVGDPLDDGAYQLVSADVTATLQANAGQFIRLRIAEADNQLFFAFGVDDVKLDVDVVPEPATMAALAIGAGMLARRRRKA